MRLLHSASHIGDASSEVLRRGHLTKEYGVSRMNNETVAGNGRRLDRSRSQFLSEAECLRPNLDIYDC